ncbi:N-acetylmuramoyl-L-alanine amidase [Desulfofundulus thermosubterraneus]|uniref:N-acetylmuramoyl-L-alanine amidase n=1 Tax=Desulfofundulus thermosubterraneus DSM 16057 TaxID=1121432 RepID=A0A1M6A682_9FIRM|nr:N-acetylmuramoyl-L-alanine amidase [Desulfofundulus thermosubterraneus]SHI31980.1 N-acetylmuramoyl-L-alanine amidase [Desulfofundulus thermosubterraneus DSM 16057]
MLIVLPLTFKKIKIVLVTALVAASLWLGLRAIVNARHQASISALSWALAGRVIVVDPGHGGVDPGVVGKNNVLEKDLVLAVGQKLALYLRQGGARVIMTREGDHDLADPELTGLYKRKRQDLARRVTLANSLPAHAMVSIHINSFSNPSQYGAQTFTRSGSPESEALARAIQDELNRLLKTNHRLPLYGDYYILRHSRVPTVIVEIGFITNPREYRLLQDPLYQSKVAWCLYAGLTRYFAGEGKKSPRLNLGKREKRHFLKGVRA